MSSKIYKQKDLFEKGERQKSSMAAVSEIHKMFDMSQTDTVRELKHKIYSSEGASDFRSNFTEQMQSSASSASSNTIANETANNQLTEQMYQQIHDIGYKAAADVYERKIQDIQAQIRVNEDNKKKNDQAYRETIKNLQSIRSDFENTLNTRAKDIIIKSCENVLQAHLKDAQFVEDYLRGVINQFKDEQDVILRLSVDMHSRVSAQIQELEKCNPKINLHIAVDPSMSMFGCVVETESQRLDLQLDNQLSKLKQLIEGL